MLWQHGLRWPRLESRDWLGLAGLAALGHVAHVNLMAQAMHLSTPFSSALISALGPMFTLLRVRLLYSERFTHIQAAGVVLAMAAVLVFLWDKPALMRTQGLGDLLLLSATVLFSAHTVAATRLLSRHGVIVVMAYSTLMAMGRCCSSMRRRHSWCPGPASRQPSGGPCSGLWR